MENLREKSLKLMAEGLALLDAGRPAEAIGFFREAGRMRDAMDWRGDAEAAWMRAASWINLADAVQRAGRSEDFPEALEATGKCIESMECLALGDHPAFPERLALAWIHNGGLLAETGDFPGAEDAFGSAEGLLREHGGLTHLAGMLMVNRARARLKADRAKDAVADARAGIGILNGVADAQAAVRARAVFCEALAALLDVPGGLIEVEDWIAEATDAVEEALAISRETGAGDGSAADLVRYGAKVYRVCQPAFLGEFLTEWLGGDGPLAKEPGLRVEMLAELHLAKAEVSDMVLRRAHETDFVERQTAVLRKLQAGEAALDG